VTKPQLLAATAACLLVIGLAVFPSVAQGPSRGGNGIALLDIGYIFKNHTRFKAEMADLRSDLQQADARMKKDRDTIRKLMEQLNDYPAGSIEYKQMEEHITKRQADLEVTRRLQQKDFMHREAKVYHNVYQEVQQEVNYYASSAGIVAVLKFNGDPVDKEKPELVLRDINKSVIWFNQGMDITPEILRRLNERRGTSSTTDTRSHPGVPRPY